MAEEQGRGRSSARRRDPAAALLAGSRQTGDREDAKPAARRGPGDEAVVAYAKALVEERQIGELADKKVAELEKRIAMVREEQQRDQAAAVARQAAALATLVKFRSAAQVGEVLGLSAKRVRALTEDVKSSGPATDNPIAVAEGTSPPVAS